MPPVITNTGNMFVWRHEPNFRGSFNIISSCIITLVLCVWTGVHPNIQVQSNITSPRSMFDIVSYSRCRSKLFWVIVALLAPEWIVYLAWSQRRAAVYLDQQAEKHLAKSRENCTLNSNTLMTTLSCRLHQLRWNPSLRKMRLPPAAIHQRTSSRGSVKCWTPVHSYYACMGGFVIDTANSQSFLPRSNTRAVLTPVGVAFMMKHDPDLIPILSDQEILDKSKADGLSKTLVCLQAAWFCLQCISRVAESLPISLLELTTFAHTLCMFAAYFLWWNKPVNVQQPTVLTGNDFGEILAYMWMSSPATQHHPGGFGLEECEFESVLAVPKSDHPDDDALRVIVDDELSTVPATYPIPILPGQELGHTGFSVWPMSTRFVRTIEPPWWLAKGYVGFFPPAGSLPRIALLNRADVLRWTLASRAIERYGLPKPCKGSGINYVSESAMELHIMEGTMINNPRDAFLFALIAAVYGGIHLLAWKHSFPSSAERMYWRCCATYIFASGATIALSGIFHCWIDEGKTSRAKQYIKSLWYNVTVEFLGILTMVVIYIVASISLLILCFRDIFYLQPGSFQVPSWSLNFPHFS